MSARAAVLRFVGKINAHDVDALCDAMTRDHVFVDGLGIGRQMKACGISPARLIEARTTDRHVREIAPALSPQGMTSSPRRCRPCRP